jgi:hypothetical protein
MDNYRFGYLLLLVATLILLFTEVTFKFVIIFRSLNIDMSGSINIGRGSLSLNDLNIYINSDLYYWV